nr:thioredoxin family protein [uncultured Acetatifactor sp.]
MAFYPYTNACNPDAGNVRGVQREVACECWFTTSGKMIPLMLKIKDEDGEIRAIHQIEVHYQEKKTYAGIPSVEFDCTLTVLGQEIRAKLIYYQTENRWVLNYK